jgi:hypothetical protein
VVCATGDRLDAVFELGGHRHDWSLSNVTKKLVFKVLLVALLLATFTAWANTHDGAGSGGRAVDMGGGQFAIIPNAPIQPDSTSSSEALGECSCTNLKRLARARSSYYQILAPRCFQEYGGKAINATCQKTADGSNAPLPPQPSDGKPQTEPAPQAPQAPADQAAPATTGTPGWSSPPPPGAGRVGAVPGPKNMGEAITGAILPGLTIILGGLLSGALGNPQPTPPQPQPISPVSNGEDSARAADASAKADAERQAAWVKQREEDLRQVREQKSFIAANAAGARQGGFDVKAHDRQLADLERRERELTRQISDAGGNTSYVAKERASVQVGHGFTEANRIAKEFEHQQAAAAARANLEELEKARQQTERDYNKNVRDGFIQNVRKDINDIPGQLKEAAKSGLRSIGTVVHDVGKVLTDKESWKQAIGQTIKDVVTSPMRSARKVAGFYGEVVSTASSAAATVVVNTVTHPIDTIKAITGIDNWEKVMDPNVPVTERLGRAIIGAIDAATSIPGGAFKTAKAADAAVDMAKVGNKAVEVEKAAHAGKAAHAKDAIKSADKPSVLVSKVNDVPVIGEIDRMPAKPLSPIERETAWHEGKQAGQQAIDNAHAAVASSDRQQIRDAALGMQENKHGLYQVNRLKDANAAQTRVAIKNEMQKVYDATDKKVCDELTEKYRKPSADGTVHEPQVRRKEITNEPKPGDPPKDPTKVPIDRDVTFERKARPGEWIPDPEKPGTFVQADGSEWVDIPSSQSGQIYDKKFQETALEGASAQTRAKYAKMSPEEFGRRMDQTVTDRLSNDAYGRGASDLDTAVRNPAGSFSDPAGVGKTSEFKAQEWFEKAGHAKTPIERETCIAEGMRQTSKQFGNQIEGRLEVLNRYRGEGSPNPGLPKVVPPQELKAGIDILKKVADGSISPVVADARLASMGMTREVVANKLGDFLDSIYRMPVAP